MTQRVIITAAASGIGKSMVAAFVALGARVHICDVDERVACAFGQRGGLNDDADLGCPSFDQALGHHTADHQSPRRPREDEVDDDKEHHAGQSLRWGCGKLVGFHGCRFQRFGRV